MERIDLLNVFTKGVALSRNVLYIVCLCLFIAAIGFQRKYLFDLQMQTDAFSGFSFVVPGNLSYMAIGLLQAVEERLAEKAATRFRFAGRLIVAVILVGEIFRLPVLKQFSLFNEWGYVMSVPSIVAAYFLARTVGEGAACHLKKGKKE